MARLKALLRQIAGLNLAYLLILGLVVKALVSDISIATFLLSIPILSYEAYKLYLKHKTPDPVVVDAEIRKELDNIKSKLNANAFNKGIDAAATPSKRYF